MTNKLVSRFIIGTFVTLYTLVSVISTIHVIDFFELSNPYWLAVTLAIGFELGAAASLASLVILDKMNKTLVWALFITITLMQMQGNMYYAFVNLEDFQTWSELFNLIEEEPLYQKRVLSFVSGAILPLVALGFIKSLVDYIKPTEDELLSEDIAGFDDIAKEGFEEDDYFDGGFADNMGFGTVEDEIEESEDWDEEDWDEDDEDLEDYAEAKANDREKFEEWDEDHALDQVLNNMADEFEEIGDFNEDLSSEFEGLDEDWDVTLADGLDEDWDDEEDWDEEEDEEVALKKALEARAEAEKKNYLKDNE
jgi:hypothetical protein